MVPVLSASMDEAGRRLSDRKQFWLAGLAVPAWLLASHFLPVLSQRPGVAMLVAFIAASLLLKPRPAMLAVGLAVVGHELLRPPAPWDYHIQRMIVTALIGSIAVALAYTRASRREAAYQYRALFERHPLPMWVFDERTLRFLAVNDAARREYGYTASEFAQLTLRDIRPAEELPLLETRPWEGRHESTSSTRHRTKDGRLMDVVIRSQAVPFGRRQARLALIENVTERRALEAQFQQAQKMEAVGRLAGGIAHDFNNLLTAVRGYAALLLESLPDSDPRRADVIEIERAGERATALTRQLLAFSRRQILQPRLLSVDDVVTGLIPMLRRLVGEAVHLHAVTRSHAVVRADVSQIEQVVMNLVVNARDAMPQGGEVTIETTDVELDELYVRQHPAARVGPHLMLSVSDSGHGMPADVRVKAFEPFFTTKPDGMGSGLGLSTVYGIVRQSGGHVRLSSEVGRGTTCAVYLPAVPDAVADAPEPPIALPTPAPPVGGASILLVEGEESLRTLMQKVLERHGYRVTTAASLAAVRATLDRQPRLDLLITDMVLADGNGRDAAAQVASVQPHCRVLFMSGYTDDVVVRQRVLTEHTPFLQKPFTAAALLENVSRMLSSEPA
jgi:two-component system, cell cycle sensor histidine kinase and response regulator CckA